MADLQDVLRTIPGRQAYHLHVPGTDSAATLSVASFDATEKMGAPTEVRIVLTHPLQLPRADYLSRDASFSIVADDGTKRQFSGFIARFSTVQTTKDYTKYEAVLKSHFARLEAVTNTGIYQHQSTPDIIAAVLRRHGLRDHQFRFRLRGQYPKHLFRMQYRMTDLAYCQMLMQKAGIYSYIVESEYGDEVVFGDDIDHYLYGEPQRIVPYREVAGLEAGGIEAVTGIQTHAVTVPQSFIVADYNPAQAWERFRDEVNIAPQDETTYGRAYVYGTHHLDQAGAKCEAQLRHEAAIARQVVYAGESNVLALQCASVLEMDTTLPDAPKGQVIVEVTHSGARDAAYSNRYTAIPADRRFRLELKPETWAKVPGTLSARVTSPDKYSYAYITAEGHYTVRFDADFATWPNGGESVPLRLAKPFAGKLRTGMHFPALDDAEAVITCRDGDPDKPEISAFHHHSQARDLVTSDRRWLSRNMIRTQKNNKLRFEDWSGQEGAKLSTEHSGKSQLSLGYLVNNKLECRGEGLELRTSGYGVNRAGKGMMFTAYDRPGATGKQLDMQETIAQLETALATAKALAASASSAKAEPADTDAQQQIKDDLDGLKKPGLLMSTPASVALVAGQGMQFSAQENINAVAGKNADWSVLKRFTVAAGEKLSLFAQKHGIKIFAAKGPVEFQAQSGPMSLIADKDVNVASVNGKVNLSAAKEIILECGGAFVQIKDGSITLGGPGDLFFKTITVQKKSKAQMQLAASSFSSKMVPFTFACDSWRRPMTSTGTASPPSAPQASDWNQFANSASAEGEPPAPAVKRPSAKAQTAGANTRNTGSPTDASGATPQAAKSTPLATTPDLSAADSDPAHEPKQLLADDPSTPMKLTAPVACDWHTPAFTTECNDTTETGSYYGWIDEDTPWPTPDMRGTRSLSGNQFDTAFELSYDEKSTTLYATVRVVLAPVDIVRCDSSGKPLSGSDGKPQSIPYDHDAHWQVAGNGVNNPLNGLVLQYRDGAGADFNVAGRKAHIEAVLNGHRSKLILNGCSKNAACGCRVSVVFKVEILLSIKNASVGNRKKIHKKINLFPQTQRADGGSWGENNMYCEKQPDDSVVWKDMPYETNVIAHECGHLFNFPDEYWSYGGWVHQQYIENKQLNFPLGNVNKDKATWQLLSQSNLMGYGANQQVQNSDKASPSATVHPYYLEYVRRHFCELTGELPQYLNNDRTKPVWRKWRIGYET